MVSRNQNFPLNLTFCSPTLHSDLRLEVVSDWLDFHAVHFGVSKYKFYDSGIWKSHYESGKVSERTKKYILESILEIIDFSGQEKYNTWFHSQVIIVFFV